MDLRKMSTQDLITLKWELVGKQERISARLGGGNIVMGNTLDPLTRLDEQTDEDFFG